MVGLIILIVGFIFKSEVTKRIAYFVFVLGALSTFPAVLSGEKAAHFTNQMEWFEKKIVHEHAEKAEFFAVFSYILGL